MQQLWITCVHHHPHGPIERVGALVYESTTNTFTTSQPLNYSRDLIIQWITSGIPVVTTTRGPTNLINSGARVILTPDRRFITSVGNNINQDNLGSLPRCS